MKFFAAVIKQRSKLICRQLDIKKEDVVSHILENILIIALDFYKKMINEGHSIRPEYISIFSSVVSMVIFHCLESREKSPKNTVLLKR